MTDMACVSDMEKLCSEIGAFSDCALITSDVNRRYYTGLRSSAGTLLVFPQKAYLIIDFRYIEKARASVRNCEVIEESELCAQLDFLMEKHGAKVCAVEAAELTVAELNRFRSKLKCELLADGSLSSLIERQRLVKSPAEIEKIKAAQSIAEMGFAHMLEYIREGRTEKETALELDFFMLRNGADAVSFDTIVLSGKNTSLPHGTPGERRFRRGDFVLMDFGAQVDGYHSDMTRTVAVGEADGSMRAVYDIVLRAQLAALDMLRSGVSGKEYDAAARKVITDSGYGEAFGHSLGHGVGLDIHEKPYCSPKREAVLPAGAVVTCEPGIYIPSVFGVRIEDMAVVRENGCDNLTSAPKELIVVRN